MTKPDRTIVYRYDSGEAGAYGAESEHERAQRERFWRSMFRKLQHGGTWKDLR